MEDMGRSLWNDATFMHNLRWSNGARKVVEQKNYLTDNAGSWSGHDAGPFSGLSIPDSSSEIFGQLLILPRQHKLAFLVRGKPLPKYITFEFFQDYFVDLETDPADRCICISGVLKPSSCSITKTLRSCLKVKSLQNSGDLRNAPPWVLWGP